ncbi:hypothetical protein OIU74_029031 [Salix koriyanagi]|uniref:Uncharacterized protein n=1 Tax=Salix koriyanagi TaxID=2511006 RepID=A0A9Q0VDD4_9ROSI|nr:hypothetical protein OIU74_029031 [Salix koriyanagi]
MMTVPQSMLLITYLIYRTADCGQYTCKSAGCIVLVAIKNNIQYLC